MLQYKVAGCTMITSGILLLTLQPRRKQDILRFQPGQYAALGFKRHGRPSPMRCFSILNSPNHPHTLQFAIRVTGNFTRALTSLQRGDTVFVRGPFGNFVLDEQYDTHAVMMAAGIGITPFMSMIRYASEAKTAVRMTLLYSNSYAEDIPFLEELRQHERQNPNFKVVHFITRGSVTPLKEQHVVSGRLTGSHIGTITKDMYNSHTYFLCGPKGFVSFAHDTLRSKDTDPYRIITEEFTPAVDAQIGDIHNLQIIPRWTYGLTGISLVLAVMFFMVLDLDHVIPKSVQVQPAIVQTNASLGNAQASTSNTGSTVVTSTAQQTSTPQTYQMPVTAVS